MWLNSIFLVFSLFFIYSHFLKEKLTLGYKKLRTPCFLALSNLFLLQREKHSNLVSQPALLQDFGPAALNSKSFNSLTARQLGETKMELVLMLCKLAAASQHIIYISLKCDPIKFVFTPCFLLYTCARACYGVESHEVTYESPYGDKADLGCCCVHTTGDRASGNKSLLMKAPTLHTCRYVTR